MRRLVVLLWSGLSVAACYSPAPPFGVPCSTSGECPRGQECDLLTNVCALPTEERVLRDDTAADFEGGTLAGTIIESGGYVGPMPYLIGGVRTSGIEGAVLEDAAAATFEELALLPVTGRGVVRGVDVDFALETPYELGLTSGDDVTVLVEGEIYLDATGEYELELYANDHGFVDLAPPGSTQFTRVVASRNNQDELGTYTANAIGWHRFRGAASDSDEYFEWVLSYNTPGPGGLRPIPDDRVRAPVDDRFGMIVDGFNEAFMHVGEGSALAPLPFERMFTSEAYGFPIGVTSFGLRWTGQILIEVAGTYSFRIDSMGGHRAWIDGTLVANSYDLAPRVTVTPPRELAPGWYDVVLDLHRDGGPPARMSFSVESGPELAGMAFPTERMRPVSGRVARFSSAASTTSTAIPDGMTLTRSVGLDLPPAYTALAIDTSFGITHPLQTTFSLVLDPPAGANIALVALGALTGTADYYRHDSIPVDRAGTAFIFLASDSTVDAMTGTLDVISATVVHTGGRPPFEPAATYTSTVREIDAARLGAVRSSVRQATLPMRISVRTCEEAAACEGEAWEEVADGATPVSAARKYFQYKVDVATSEDTPSSLDWIEVEYVGYVQP